MSATQRQARLLEAVAPVPFARLPNEEWLAFLDGPLNAADWALIECVVSGDLTTDEAMTIKKRIAA